MFALGMVFGSVAGALIMGWLVTMTNEELRERAGRTIFTLNAENVWLRAYCRQVVGIDPDSVLEPTVGHQ